MKLWPLVLLFACKSHDKPAPAPDPVTTPPHVVADAKPAGPEKANVDFVLNCVAAENAGTLDTAKCYEAKATIDTPLAHATTPALITRFATLDRAAFADAKQEPQLVVANGSTVIVIALMYGTHTAPLETWHGTIAAQKHSAGILVARQIEIEDGKIRNESQYFDIDTLAAQLGIKTTATLAPAMAPTGKAPDIVLASGSDDESKLRMTSEVLFHLLDDTVNTNFADWIGDSFTLIDNELPAPIAGPQFTSFITAARTGLKARPNPVGYVVAKDVACIELNLDVTQDGAIAELGLAEPPKGKTPMWAVPSLVCARFASYKDRTGKLSMVYAFHRDRPSANVFVETGKVAIKGKSTGMLDEGYAQGNVDLNVPYSDCRNVAAPGFVGTAKLAMQIGVDGKFVAPPKVTGVPAPLAACIQATLVKQEFPHPDVLTDATFSISFAKPSAPKPFVGPLADTFADRLARKPIAETPF